MSDQATSKNIEFIEGQIAVLTAVVGTLIAKTQGQEGVRPTLIEAQGILADVWLRAHGVSDEVKNGASRAIDTLRTAAEYQHE